MRTAMRLLAPSLLAMTALLATPALAGERVDKAVEGFWTAYEYFEDDGSFVNCGLETKFADGMRLSLRTSGQGFYVYLLDVAWPVKKGEREAIEIRIDQAYDRFTGVAITDLGYLQANFGYDSAFWRAFRKGRGMTLSLANGRSWNIDLKGSSKTTDALEFCYRSNEPAKARSMFD